MPRIAPLPETLPTEIVPPCPGCPDPHNARRIDLPCSGPQRIQEQGEFDNVCLIIGQPVVAADIIYCPRTRGSRVE